MEVKRENSIMETFRILYGFDEKEMKRLYARLKEGAQGATALKWIRLVGAPPYSLEKRKV